MNRRLFIACLTLLTGAGFAKAQPPVSIIQPAAYQPVTLTPSNVGRIANPSYSFTAGAAGSPSDVLPALWSPDASDSGGAGGCCVPSREVCGGPGRFWASAEYLLWWMKDDHLPPLVTAGTPASRGVIGPGTTVLFGGSNLDQEEFSGGRFTLGLWLDECKNFGLETQFFFLGSRADNFTAGGSGGPNSPVIARPVFEVPRNAENAELVSFPGVIGGTVKVSEHNRLWGAEANGLVNLYRCCDYRIDLLAGVRYLESTGELSITENLSLASGLAGIGGSRIGVADTFHTRNRFLGGQLGARAEYQWNNVFANLALKVALGGTHEVLSVNGATSITPAGGTPTLVRGGILALPTNSGRFSRDDFSVVPEIGINIGYQLNPHIRAFMGYTFLYWSDAARPGDQIDRAVNLSQIPATGTPPILVGPARPAVLFKDTDFWAQGINFGVDFRY